MTEFVMDMILCYARVFPEVADMGKDGGNDTQQVVFDKGGQFVVDAYFTDEYQIARLKESGLKMMTLGQPRIRDGNPEFGIGKYLKLKTDLKEVKKSFVDKKSGKTEYFVVGGPIPVKDMTVEKGEDGYRDWSYSEDGPLGNGTLAKVHFTSYKDGVGLRLSGIGVVKHVPYEESNGDAQQAKELFK